jgi:alkylation response protein AidB-like acyl-CoA dehydrogenase
LPLDETEFASLKAEIEAFVRGPGEDYTEQIERTHEVPQALWLDLRERGYLSLAAPVKYGGQGPAPTCAAAWSRRKTPISCPAAST